MLTPASAATSLMVGRDEFARSDSVNVGRLTPVPPVAEDKFKNLLLQSKPICVIPDNVVR
jgi:hypothetical protein